MKGHIRKRYKSSWSIVVDLGLKPDGKRNQVWKSVKGTKTQAEEVLNEMLHSFNTGTYIEPTNETVSEFLDYWLDEISDSVRANTLERYESICKFYIKPIIGETKLIDLKPVQINSLYKELQREGRPGGDKLCARTVLHAHRVLSNALNKAVKWEMLLRNPCQAADAPKAKKSKRQTFTSKETIEILNKASGTNLFLPILIAVTTGLRRGEFLGLRWTDINFDKKELTVKQSAIRTSEGVIYDAPKTETSNRTIPFPDMVLNALKVYRAEQAKLYLQLGKSLDNNAPIMSGIGGFKNPSQLTTNYRAFIKRNNFKHVTYHGLRHTHATLLLAENIHPKVMSERLGHSTIAITMDLYSHVMPTMQREASNTINTMFVDEGFKG